MFVSLVEWFVSSYVTNRSINLNKNTWLLPQSVPLPLGRCCSRGESEAWSLHYCPCPAEGSSTPHILPLRHMTVNREEFAVTAGLWLWMQIKDYNGFEGMLNLVTALWNSKWSLLVKRQMKMKLIYTEQIIKHNTALRCYQSFIFPLVS